MGPVPRRGTHAPVRTPHGEHARRGPGRAFRAWSLARPAGLRPGPGVGVRHRARDAGRLPYKLGSSRRVPRTPRPFSAPKARAERIARAMTHDLTQAPRARPAHEA